jgi:hypothetical protein
MQKEILFQTKFIKCFQFYLKNINQKKLLKNLLKNLQLQINKIAIQLKDFIFINQF